MNSSKKSDLLIKSNNKQLFKPMFSGIIQDIGTILSYKRHGDDVSLVIGTSLPFETYGKGASISCSGVCLTVVRSDVGHFEVEASAETLAKTNLGEWKEGGKINLEPSLKLGDELCGHLVFGHIDTQVKITSIQDDGESWRLKFEVPAEYQKFYTQKGSVCLDGISLTVNEVEDNIFGVCIIPYTWSHTTLSSRKVGDLINFEVDMLARYVSRQLEVKAAA